MSNYIDKNIDRGRNFMDRIEEILFPGEISIEGTGYERNILDRRIEKYLDQHFEEYIEEFGLVRKLDIEVYEAKYNSITNDIKKIDDFQQDMESELVFIHRRLDKIEEMK